MAKDDLKISMSTILGPDDRVDRTISYVNGNVDNSVLSSLASQLVGLTTNTYLGGEKIQRTDISEPGGSSSATVSFSFFDGGNWDFTQTTSGIEVSGNVITVSGFPATGIAGKFNNSTSTVTGCFYDDSGEVTDVEITAGSNGAFTFTAPAAGVYVFVAINGLGVDIVAFTVSGGE